MKFKKGQSGNASGRPKGAKGAKTQAWEELGEFFTKEGAETAIKIINKYGEVALKEDGEIDFPKAEKYLLHYSNLLEYFKPKQARVINEQENEVIVKVVHES